MIPLNILHVYRSPVGGLFRHVIDLAQGQAERGHNVGMIVSDLTGGARAEEILAGLAPQMRLGITRIPMHRQLHPRDFFSSRHVSRRIMESNADVIHGHGAKGGAFARLASAPRKIVRAYTPHGGSLLFSRNTTAGNIYLILEQLLMQRGTLYLFESAYSEAIFRSKVGHPRGLVHVVHNGVSQADFSPAPVSPDATDLLFLGELRMIKGIDVLLNALAVLKRDGRTVTLTLVGTGPSAEELRQLAGRLGLQDSVCFKGALPARTALTFGRTMVVPSRAESLPYVVLEAAAAGKPLIATNVGGISEIFGPQKNLLIPSQDVTALARAIARALDEPDAVGMDARDLRQRVADAFSLDAMVDNIIDGYRQSMAAAKHG